METDPNTDSEEAMSTHDESAFVQPRLVRIVARCVFVAGCVPLAALIFVGLYHIISQAVSIPWRSWIEAFGVVATIACLMALWLWAMRGSEF